ncbi:MAG: DUF305 domain-containing protein [Ferruginibacter sp.]
MQHDTQTHNMASNTIIYRKLIIMLVISFIAMYILMYAMVDSFPNVILNINQFYMAGLMTMAMVLIELVVMSGMYKNSKLNMAIFAIGFIALLGFYFGIRQQAAVGDKQFLKSMIPHHAAAILMVKKATLTDPEIIKLGQNIINAQQEEIAQMKAKLKQLDK